MAEYPNMPLWTDAYIGDTAHLTNEEHGVYLRLLMFAWRSPGCCLPDDDKRLALMVGVTPKKWAALRPVISQFWRVGDGRWTQKRLTAEREKVQGRSEKGEAAAEARWRPKALKNNKPQHANASLEHGPEHMPQPCPPSPSPYPEENRGGGDRARDTRASDPPEPEPAPLTFRERIRAACGVDPTSGLTGRGSARLADQADMLRVKGWFQLGLTPDEILIEISTTMAGKTDGPPSSLKFFDKPMARLAAAKAAPPPEIPEITHPPKGAFHGRAPQNRPDRRADESQRLSRILDAAARGTT